MIKREHMYFIAQILLTYTYDAFGRVTDMVYTKNGTVIEGHSYTYDKNSNIKKEANVNTLNQTSEIREYTYDYMGQLTDSILKNVVTSVVEVETGESDEDGNVTTTTQIVTTENVVGTASYQYDKVGNRIKKTENGTSTTYTYNGLNQLTKESGTSNLTYGYDANGNQISVSGTAAGASVSKTYSYTPSGMLASYKSGSDSQTNLYSGEGQRVQKKEGSDITNYYYQQGSVLYTTDGSGALKSFNLLNLADAFATSRKDGSTESYYFLTEDLRGSTINVVDNAGEQVVSYWYDDFGSVAATKSANYRDFVGEIQYTGAIYDELTGLLYLNARFYDPSTGRFLTQDTYRGERDDAESWHLYVYCMNNPINFADPTGHSPWGKILRLADYRKIHNMVADLYAKSLGLKLSRAREVYVKEVENINGIKNGKRRWGFLDIYNYARNQYYEVKSLKASGRKSTLAQLKKYNNSATKGNTAKVVPGTTSKSGNFYYGVWYVKYRFLSPGLVVYEPTLSKYTIATVKAMAVGGLIVGAFYTMGPAGALLFI